MGRDYFPAGTADYLKNEYEMRKLRRPQYSLRAFARDLELSPSSLTDFLHGRIGFSSGRVEKISSKIGLTTEQKKHFMDLCASQFSRSMNQRKLALVRVRSRIQPSSARIELDTFKLISEWQHLAILELLELDEKYQDAKVMAKDLDIPTSLVRSSIQRMRKLGLIVEDGLTLKPSSDFTMIGSDIPSQSIRHFHAQVLAKAAKAIESQGVDQRENSSTIFSCEVEDLPDIKKDLKEFRLKLMNKYAQGESKNSLYCLSIQLFDLLEGK